MPLPEDVSEEIRQALSGLFKGETASAFQEAFRPLIEAAFRQGMAFGIRKVLNGGSILLASFEQTEPNQSQQQRAGASSEPERPRRRYRRRAPPKQKRAPSGAVGRIVDLVLAEHPGSRVVEIGDLVVQRDPTISRSSVTNELRRKLGQRYRKEGVRWFRIGDTEKRMGADRALSDEPDLLAGRPGLPAAAA
jgi:hypothetical protein